jgi:hypothetical protein
MNVKLAMCVVLALCAMVEGTAGQQAAAVEGVWRVVQVQDSTGTNTQPQPNLYIFTKRHYSIIQVVGQEPRRTPADMSKATAEELQAVFGSTFQANAGTYSTPPGFLSMRPIVSKQPASMAPGTSIVFGMTMQGQELVLTSTGRGGITYRLKRLE